MANFISNLYNLMTQQKQPTQSLNLPLVQMGDNGEAITKPYTDSMAEQKNNIARRLSNAFLGTPVGGNNTMGTMTTDEEGNYVMPMGIENKSREGGIFRDIASGYRDNRNNAFSLDNWNGEKKNAAQRIGEILGTTARIADSPWGRALIVGGLVGANGGNGLQALTYGAQTGMVNQQNRLNDQLYRQDLANQGIDTSNVKGYMNDASYKNLLTSKQLQDNAEWRKLNIETQNRQNEIMNQMRQDQFEETKAQNAFNRMLAGQKLSLDERQLALGYAKLEADKMGEYAKMLEKEQEKANEYKDVENQLKAFEGTFKEANNPLRYRVFGGASNALNTLSPSENNFNAQRTLLFNQIARKLGGEKGVLSDQDIRRVEAALPSLSDTFEQKQAKMKAIYNLLDIKKGGTGNTQSVGKYKVTVKG